MTYRLYPSPSQEKRLLHYLYVGRKLYNHSLEQRIQYYKETGKSLSLYDQYKDLAVLRSASRVLSDVPSHVERSSLDRLGKAYKAFFRRVKAGEKPGFPRFKSDGRWNSFSTSQPGLVIKGDGKVFVSGVGKISARNVRQFPGKAKVLRIVLRAGKWSANVSYGDGLVSPPLQTVKTAIGIDVGLVSFATFSDGTKIENPRFYRKLERKLARAQRNVSRKNKGIANRRKAIRKVQLIHAKIADQRSNFTHHLSKQIVADHQLIAVENLNIAGMAKNRRLSKSIMDAAWGQLLERINYKAESAGCLFVKVPAPGTSQDCSGCGEKVLKDLSVRIHSCLNCGLVLDRDINAAKNILQRAISAPGPDIGIGKACGEDVRLLQGSNPRRSRKPMTALSLPSSVF